ncbi:MAG: extracellular solute-binding protein [Anaerolineae bacterium]
MRNTGLVVLVFAALLGTAGCEILSSPTPAPTSPVATVSLPPPSTPTTTPENTVVPTGTPATGLTTLTLWIPDFMDLYDETGNPTYLMEQIEAFNQTHRNVQVNVLVKKASGTGGLYNLLDTAAPVAPGVLPDVVVLNETDLYRAAREALIQPLPETFSPPPSTYAIALKASRPLTVPHAVPLLMNIEQTVYNPRLALTAPLSWTAVLSGGYSLLFPAAPPNDLADDAVLSAYLGAGGTLVDESGSPFLDRTTLEKLYGFLDTLQEENRLNAELVMELSDANACWNAYQERRATLSVVPAAAYWTTKPRIDAPGWIPTPNGTPYSIAHVWSLALVTSDPARQEAARQLVMWLSGPERAATLSQQTETLPTNREALALWGLMPEELSFFDTLLASAALPPLTEKIDRPIRQALQAGVRLLLEEPEATPAQAAAQALLALRK